jgi:AcrR family transcriptional regulator
MFNNGGMSKSEITRRIITETAVASFKERGYEQTTIRLIASEAGISVGNAYYYFPTKTHLVQELYLQVQREHTERARVMLEGRTDLASRLEAVLLAGIDTLAPYHDSAPGFLAAMVPPASGVNPLGPESIEARGIVVDLFRELVDGSTTSIPTPLRAQLPDLLWFAYLGLALYFVYDTSPGQKRTRRLASRASALIGTLLPLARLPFVRGPLTEALDIVAEARA